MPEISAIAAEVEALKQMTQAPTQPATAPRWWTIADICREMQIGPATFHRTVAPQIERYKRKLNRNNVRYLRLGVIDWMESQT